MNSKRSNTAHHLGLAMLIGVASTGCSASGQSTPTVASAPQSIRQMAEPAKSAPLLYVANEGGDILEYSTGANPTLVQTITNGVPEPGGIWIDNHNILYAVNASADSNQTSLPEYKPGATSPFRTLTKGITNADYVAVDKLGTVYVAGMDLANDSFFLETYRKGAFKPEQTLTIPHPNNTRLSGLAFDTSGALLVGESVYFQQGTVYRLAPGSHTFTNLNLQGATGGTIAVDKAGNLYVGSGSSAGVQEIEVYPPNSTSPAREIQVQNILYTLAVQPSGELYVETGGGGPVQVSVYPPGSDYSTESFDVAGGGSGLALSR